jgi:glycosyltransferase involved in cell wall biosynthesis
MHWVGKAERVANGLLTRARRVAVLFHRLGPYHHARLSEAGRILDVTAVELSAVDDTYAWAPVGGARHFRRITLFRDRDVVYEPGGEVVNMVQAALEEARPEAVAVAGWSDRGALAALAWCSRTGTPAVVMSESTSHDVRRVWWKEQIKRRLVGLCAAGLVGGTAHAQYLARLGMHPGRIFVGYDVVDNDHFRRGAEAARAEPGARQGRRLPDAYFLASSRFIAKKNLPRLLQAYARYRRQAGARAWHLVVLGDGELRPELDQCRDTLGLREHVHLPGFKQYDELPAYYGLAGAFVHASTAEPWGLVVNEAMAAGLPVLVSDRCGCAPDLVEPGRNGYTFDPLDVEGLSRHLLRTAGGEYDLAAMGRASREIIARWTPATFARNLERAVEAALQRPRQRAGVADRVLLWARVHL